MTEQYWNFETAKLLKQAGMPVGAIGYFFAPGQDGEEDEYSLDWENVFGSKNCWLPAGTLSLAQKWLREAKKFLIEVKPLDSWDNWIYKICEEDCCSPFFELTTNPELEFKTYEEALEAGIVHALKSLPECAIAS